MTLKFENTIIPPPAPGVGGAQQLHPLLVAAEERLLGGVRGQGEGGEQQQQHGVSSALVAALAHGHGIRRC